MYSIESDGNRSLLPSVFEDCVVYRNIGGEFLYLESVSANAKSYFAFTLSKIWRNKSDSQPVAVHVGLNGEALLTEPDVL